MSKTRIGFDLDGVLYDWHTSVLEYLKEIGKIPEDLSFEELWHTYWNEHINNTQLEDNILGLELLYGNMPMDERTIEILEELREDYEYYFITHRWKNMEQVTRGWLDRYGLLKEDNLFMNADKPLVARELGLSVFVEDRVKNVESLENVLLTFVVDKPWNRDFKFKRAIRINHVSEIGDFI